MRDKRFQRAIALIDAENSRDPNTISVGGETRPKELAHAEMVTAWIERLDPDAGEALLLAARAHHIRRWEHPRSQEPPGRGGYLRWRTGLYKFHAEAASALLEDAGYDEETIARVAALVSRRAGLADPDGQALEDAVCLVFFETQLADMAARLDRDRMVNILRRTWRKMSPAGHAQVRSLRLDSPEQELLEQALSAS